MLNRILRIKVKQVAHPCPSLGRVSQGRVRSMWAILVGEQKDTLGADLLRTAVIAVI